MAYVIQTLQKEMTFYLVSRISIGACATMIRCCDEFLACLPISFVVFDRALLARNLPNGSHPKDTGNHLAPARAPQELGTEKPEPGALTQTEWRS
jgi:hypothetical protein